MTSFACSLKYHVLLPVPSRFLYRAKMAKLDERIGFLGGGNMAFAIGYGLINRGIFHAKQNC